jgi:serine/threonine-protein kinase
VPHPPYAPPPRRGRGVLIGALAAVALLVVAGAVFAAVTLTRHRDPATTTTPGSNAANGSQFTGTYRADYGPGTDLEGNPVAGAPATTATWGVRSTCGASGCVATASIIGGGGITLVSNAAFDQLSGAWVAVSLVSTDCNGPTDIWVVYTLQPQPDGTLSGETTRASTNGACAAKLPVKFTRTGDVDVDKVPDPAVLPPRTASAAEALRGRYRESTTFTNGNKIAGQGVLTVDTVCLRNVDRCMSLFHGAHGTVTLIFADGKWTRKEEGLTNCAAGGTAQITNAAEYPLPEQLEDPIAVLTGRGTQTVAAGGACAGGGDFVDVFERIGD